MSEDLSEPQKKRIKDSIGIQPDTPEDSDLSDSVEDSVVEGNDLEAELAAITGEKKVVPLTEQKSQQKLIPSSELEKMVADCMKDVGSDEEETIDDLTLEKELQEITGCVPADDKSKIVMTNGHGNDENNELVLSTTIAATIEIIKARIQMYDLAEKDAESDGETSRARRFNRGLKTLHELLKQANSGKPVNNSEIPPEVIIKLPNVNALKARKQEYESAIEAVKQSGNEEMEKQYRMVIEQFARVINELDEGKEVDFSDMPPPPSGLKSFLEKMSESKSQQ